MNGGKVYVWNWSVSVRAPLDPVKTEEMRKLSAVNKSTSRGPHCRFNFLKVSRHNLQTLESAVLLDSVSAPLFFLVQPGPGEQKSHDVTI